MTVKTVPVSGHLIKTLCAKSIVYKAVLVQRTRGSIGPEDQRNREQPTSVFEPAISKTKCLNIAAGAAVTTIRSDDMIKIDPPRGEDMSYLQAYPDSSVNKGKVLESKSAISKVISLKLATKAAIMILTADDMIKIDPPRGEEKSYPWL